MHRFGLVALALAITAPAALSKELGWLSEKYEVGKGGPGTISSGKGDAGGVSYGTYQLTTANVGAFVKKHYAKEFAGLKAPTKAFNDKWRELAKADRTFGKKQHDYIKANYYDQVKPRLKKEQKLDLDARSETLRNVVWSTSVQHGNNGCLDVFKTAIGPLVKKKAIEKVTDEEIIKAVYAERGRKNKDGSLARFKGNSKEVQQAVARRFVNEMADALKALKEEKKK